ncbi:MAG TPA: SPFH domain-containing protein [Novosphingobium sp.]|nr:SPFH domain-containing protein [Novosphingobium sp.]
MVETLRRHRHSLFGLAILALLGLSSFVIVPDDQQAVVTRMGEPDRVVNRFRPDGPSGAGIVARVPLMEQVVWLPRGLTTFSHQTKRVRSADEQWLLVDTDVTYRIIDPVKLVNTLGSAGKIDGQLGALLPPLLDEALGKQTAGTIARPGSGGATAALLRGLDQQTRKYGIQVIDLRIARLALDEKGRDEAFARMKERQEAEIMAVRQRKYAEAAEITQAALLEAAARSQQSAARDPEFYAFFQAMRSYERVYGDPNRKNSATFVLPPDSGYLKHFGGK